MILSSMVDIHSKFQKFWKLNLGEFQENRPSLQEKFDTEINFLINRQKIKFGFLGSIPWLQATINSF